MDKVLGLHHITAISGDAQENLDFYSGVLGMRLVKRSVNQDDPKTYHLFYADAKGNPGTDLTFFPWKDMPRAQPGVGLTSEVQLAVPTGSSEYWQTRLAEQGVSTKEETRFGEKSLLFGDPHGMALALVETADEREFSPWEASFVPAEYQVRGLHGARVWERDLNATETFLLKRLGFEKLAEEKGWHRYGLPSGADGIGGSGRILDLREVPEGRRGQWGVGGVHHLAWRVRNEEHALAVREQVDAAGRRPTDIIDRFWFKSVYFMEPGGVLFELATDGPGFAIDEDADKLGESLILPPWLESSRAQIEAGLPELSMPKKSEVSS